MEPFSLPSHWRRYITIDYGLDMLAAYWIRVDEQKAGVCISGGVREGLDHLKGSTANFGGDGRRRLIRC